MSDRLLRICDVCGVIDDEPRHQFVTVGVPVNQEHVSAVLGRSDLDDTTRSRILSDIFDTNVQQRHMSCCHDAGCPDAGGPGDCAPFAATGLTGAELLDFIAQEG